MLACIGEFHAVSPAKVAALISLRGDVRWAGLCVLRGMKRIGGGSIFAGRGNPHAVVLNPSQQPQEAVQNGPRAGWAAGDIKVNGNDAVGAVMDFGMVDVRPAGDGASADGNDDLGRRNSVVSLLQCEAHVFRNGTGDEQAVGVARG